MDVAEIILGVGGDRRHPSAMQAPDRVEQRDDGVAQHQRIAFQVVQVLDVVALRALAAEDAVLDRLEVGFELVDDREIAVDDGVHQRVQHEPGTHLEQARLALGTLAHAEETLGRIAPHGQHVVGTGEDRDFAGDQFVAVEVDGVDDREQRVAVFLELGPLVAARGVFDGQFVQVEFLLHLGQLLRLGIAQRDPDEAAGLLQVFADILDRDIGQFLAFLVGDAVDQHGLNR